MGVRVDVGIGVGSGVEVKFEGAFLTSEGWGERDERVRKAPRTNFCCDTDLPDGMGWDGTGRDGMG